MSILDNLERAERRWTLDDMGHHIQYGDLLDEAAEEIKDTYDLFTMEEVSERLMEQLDQHLIKVDGTDRKSVPVADVRTALTAAGL